MELSSASAHQPPSTNGVSVEAIEEQRARLEADLAAATARKLLAQHRAAELDAEAKELLRVELATSRETLAEIERQHAETVALVRRNAQSEVDRILADAQRRAGSTSAEIRRTRDGRSMIDEAAMTDAHTAVAARRHRRAVVAAA